MKATEVWSYPKISKSITSEQILNECAIMAAGEALLLSAKKNKKQKQLGVETPVLFVWHCQWQSKKSISQK